MHRICFLHVPGRLSWSQYFFNFSPMLRCVANDMNRWKIVPSLLIDASIIIMAFTVSLFLLQFGMFWQHKRCSMGENAFHMVFQERWVFSHSSPNPALPATRLWEGYGELVGENSISPGKPCEMHIISHTNIHMIIHYKTIF